MVFLVLVVDDSVCYLSSTATCLSPSEDMLPDLEDDEEEPDWLKTEREQFAAFRDKDGDGKLNRDEVAEWIMPPDYDHSEAETKHLLFESDGNRVCTPLHAFQCVVKM